MLIPKDIISLITKLLLCYLLWYVYLLYSQSFQIVNCINLGTHLQLEFLFFWSGFLESYIILMFWSLSVSHQHLTFWLQLVRHCSWMFWLPLIRHNHLSLCLSFHSIAALQCEGLAFICTTSSYNGLASIRLALPLDVISFNPTDITI
jgi:hypothetical protein